MLKRAPEKVIAVVGSRTGIPIRVIVDKLKIALKHYEDQGVIVTLVSGGAEGVDKAAEYFANTMGLEIIVIPADWKTHGRSAGMRRNADIIAKADIVMAFWDGKSPGTRNSIQRARAANKKLYIFNERGEKV
jgi:hypothetical protein